MRQKTGLMTMQILHVCGDRNKLVKGAAGEENNVTKMTMDQ